MAKKKFKAGDRVKALIAGEWITAEVLKYDETAEVLKYDETDVFRRSSVWCKWDDDGQNATIQENSLEFDIIHDSPLMKALR